MSQAAVIKTRPFGGSGVETPVAPRRAIDVPRRVTPRRALQTEPGRPFPLRRVLVGAAVAVGMVGGGIASPFVDAGTAAHVETLAAPPPQVLPSTPVEAAAPEPVPVPSVPATRVPGPQEAAERDRASRNAQRAAPVVGIVSPCEVDVGFPDAASMAEIKSTMERQWQLTLTGDAWTNPEFKPVVKVLWQTLDAVDCSPYLDDIRGKVGGTITINAGRISGYAWGDWGLTRPNTMSLDFHKMLTGHQNGETTRIARVFIHELAHVHNVDRGASPQYWKTFGQLYRQHGSIASYDRGRDITETYAEAVAHYVVRCSTDNPYSTSGNAAYYDFVQEHVFDGREFGPASGQQPACG